MANWDTTDRAAEEGQERKRVPIRHLQRKSQAQTTSRIVSDNKMELAYGSDSGYGQEEGRQNQLLMCALLARPLCADGIHVGRSTGRTLLGSDQ